MAHDIIDFHSHFVPPRFELTTVATAPPGQAARWAQTNKLISDETKLLAAIEAGDISGRVVNTPTAHICDGQGDVPDGTILRINDELAELQRRHPAHIFALATVHGYDGDASGREVERAVQQLGLRGVFMECARGTALIDSPLARPTLAAAARLGVPVFVHPVNPEPMTTQMSPYGRIGTLFARGTVNAQALIALVEGGVFRELPALRVVVTTLAFGGLATLGGFAHFAKDPAHLRHVLQNNVLIDTMEFDPVSIKASVEIAGAHNVVAGSDWPIVNDGDIRGKLGAALTTAGLPENQQRAIAAGNARRLLQLA